MTATLEERPALAPAGNRNLAAVLSPPIAQAQRWLAAYNGALGPPVDLSQAVPGHPPSPVFTEHFAAAARQAETARYGPILGDAALRGAFAADVADAYGARLHPSRIAITAGANQAFFVAALAVAAPGDAVILPAPWYFNHQMTLAMLGIEPRLLETSAENGFLPDPAAFEALVDPSVRAVALVSPNNPTGAVYPAGLLADIFAICRRRGLFLILDETYRDFLPEASRPPHALFSAGGWEHHLVSLYSFSKSHAIPGHRLGAMIAGPDIIEASGKNVDCLEICASRPSQAALAASIAPTRAWRAGKAVDVIQRGAAFRRAMAGLADWPIDQLGAYFAYVRHPFADVSSKAVAKALAERLGLLVLPGSFFGPGQERHLRIAFANTDDAGTVRFAERLAAGGPALAGTLSP